MRLRNLFPAAAVAFAVVLAVVVSGLLATNRRERAAASGAPAPVASVSIAPSFSAGVAPAFSLPDDAHPIKATIAGKQLAMLATPAGQRTLALYTFEFATRLVRRIDLPLVGGGVLADIAASADGSLWIAAFDRLVHVRQDGTMQEFAIPRPRHVFPPALRGPSSPSGLPPTEDGQATALIEAGDQVLIGRMGYPEITRFDPNTATFTHLPLYAVGDVQSFTGTSAGAVFFVVRRSGVTTTLFDGIGMYEPSTERARRVEQAARAIASNGHLIAFSGYGLGLLRPSGDRDALLHSSNAYDEHRVAIRSDDTLALKVASRPAIAFLDRSGAEIKRVEYAAVLGRTPGGGIAPYDSALTFAVVGASDEVWFALFGRPDVYRIDR